MKQIQSMVIAFAVDCIGVVFVSYFVEMDSLSREHATYFIQWRRFVFDLFIVLI